MSVFKSTEVRCAKCMKRLSFVNMLIEPECIRFHIPDELSSIVNKTIATRRRKNRALPWIASVAAACALLFAGVNASPAFAKAMSDVPVLGEIVKVMTIREYAEQEWS